MSEAKKRKPYVKSKKFHDELRINGIESDIYFLKTHLNIMKEDTQEIKYALSLKQNRGKRGWELEAAATEIKELTKRVIELEQKLAPKNIKPVLIPLSSCSCPLTAKEKVKKAKQMLKEIATATGCNK
jgi:hypothetical protein